MSSFNSLVCIIHDQAKNIPRLCTAWAELEVQPDLYVFVLDRCRDDSKRLLVEFAQTHSVRLVETELESQFTAGRNRDLGVRAAEEENPNTNVLFLDGDCVPTSGLFGAHVAVFDLNNDFPIVTVGRRVSEKENSDALDEDRRMTSYQSYSKVFKDTDNVVVARDVAYNRMLTWSCCMGFNHKAIEIMRLVNFELNRSDTVFNPIFDGFWGGEDDFCAMIASHFGVAIVAISPKHLVQHIWHPSRSAQLASGPLHVKQESLRQLAAFWKAPGVTTIRCSNSFTDVSRCNNLKALELRSPILQHILAEYNDVDKAALATALSSQIVWELDGTNATSATREDVIRLRLALNDVVTDVHSPELLRNLKYDWSPEVIPCPICGSEKGYMTTSLCRGCCSSSWHRLKAVVTKYDVGRKLVLNPESRGERKLFKGWDFVSYKGLHGDRRFDVTNMDFKDGSYDTIYSSHMLEHVIDEGGAMRELRRVLSKDGTLLLALPCRETEHTQEFIGEMPGRERRHRFGWWDHIRIYGRDVMKRLASHGFDVTLEQAWQHGQIGGVSSGETIFVLKKQINS